MACIKHKEKINQRVRDNRKVNTDKTSTETNTVN